MAEHVHGITCMVLLAEREVQKKYDSIVNNVCVYNVFSERMIIKYVK